MHVLARWGLLAAMAAAMPMAAETPKQKSSLFPRELGERARANKAKHAWAATLCDGIAERAKPWMETSDEDLWKMVFGPAITRSHMVWSSGHCPACKRPVRMYNWEINAWKLPWKTRCPHCRETFPKNDFHKFYRSGLNEQGVFDPAKADRRLLFNAEHPDPADPLHRFGVDDGEGYTEGANRWRFIGAYLQYGQFRQLILAGIENLAAAYVVTGDGAYAHKAGVLLDRLADVFPTFDFASQGLVYERRRYGGGMAGYVTYAIDSTKEVLKLALAYDQVFEALRDDPELARFLAAKAAQHKLENRKSGFGEIQRNIEERILRDALRRPEQIKTNYPGTEATLAILKTVLDWPGNRAEVLADIDGIVAKSTAVDGLSGEKGLDGYAMIAPRFLTDFLELYGRADEKLLPELLARHPKLRQTYHFHVDTWCGRQYYPHSGDAGGFATRATGYAGANLPRDTAEVLAGSGLPSSAHSFFWRMHKATGDPIYLQLSYLENGNRTDNLPYDVFAADPVKMQADVRAAVSRGEAFPKPGSVNKPGWRIAILRSPRDPDAGAVWLDYDSNVLEGVRGHNHMDAMNLGLFARGLDLLPEFGYPAVQFGDWATPQARWHTLTAAHNTVVVDGKNQFGGAAQSTLWADGKVFRAVRASSPEQVRGQQYERTVAMVDLPERDFYVLDVFRVSGGADHAKFLRGHFGTVATEGLKLSPAADYGNNTLMRGFAGDAAAKPGWSAVWTAEDRRGYLPKGAEVRLRHTDLTRDAQAYTAESWTVWDTRSTEDFWIPTLMTRRQGTAPLTSTFVGVLEPFERTPRVRAIRRLDLGNDAHVAVECVLEDGRKDVWIAADGDAALREKTSGLEVRGQMAFARWSAKGELEHLAVAEAQGAGAGDVALELTRKAAYVELAFADGRAVLLSGDARDIKSLKRKGKAVRWRVQARSQRSSQP